MSKSVSDNSAVDPCVFSFADAVLKLQSAHSGLIQKYHSQQQSQSKLEEKVKQLEAEKVQAEKEKQTVAVAHNKRVRDLESKLRLAEVSIAELRALREQDRNKYRRAKKIKRSVDELERLEKEAEDHAQAIRNLKVDLRAYHDDRNEDEWSSSSGEEDEDDEEEGEGIIDWLP